MSAKAEGDPSGEGRRFGSSQYGSQKQVSGLSLSRRGQLNKKLMSSLLEESNYS